MLLHAPPIGPRVGEDEAADDAANVPTESAGYFRCQPLLLVHLGEHPLDIVDSGLELGDEQRSSQRVECEIVDAAAIPEVVVGHFVPRRPRLRRPPLVCRPPFLERGMVSVDQSVELAASPLDEDDQSCIERLDDPARCAHRAGPQIATLDAGYHRRAATGAPPKLALSPVPSMAQGSDSPANAISGHRRQSGDRRLPPP